MSYSQLSQNERSQISALLKAQHNQAEIARILVRSPGTISREISRNSGKRGYRPKQAGRKGAERKTGKSKVRILKSTWEKVKILLNEKWSPEQISGWLKSNRSIDVSHEWIYQYILRDKKSGGDLYKHLRCTPRAGCAPSAKERSAMEA